MKSAVLRLALGCALAGSLSASMVLAAEEGTKTLPTLLIKGEVVSVDANDPAAVLLKVKDRYGFETPIYLPSEVKIAQGDKALTATELSTGTAVEVEYNFDINTAKRHAVSVKVAAPAPAATEAAAAPAAPADVPVAQAAPEAAAPEASTETAPAAAPEQGAAPVADPSAP